MISEPIWVSAVDWVEVWIRMTFGASLSSLLLMFSKDIALVIGWANLVAWPVAYYLMNSWLEKFAYRIDLGPGVFLLGERLFWRLRLPRCRGKW